MQSNSHTVNSRSQQVSNNCISVSVSSENLQWEDGRISLCIIEPRREMEGDEGNHVTKVGLGKAHQQSHNNKLWELGGPRHRGRVFAFPFDVGRRVRNTKQAFVLRDKVRISRDYARTSL